MGTDFNKGDKFTLREDLFPGRPRETHTVAEIHNYVTRTREGEEHCCMLTNERGQVFSAAYVLKV
jgi:hypothetical protein